MPGSFIPTFELSVVTRHITYRKWRTFLSVGAVALAVASTTLLALVSAAQAAPMNDQAATTFTCAANQSSQKPALRGILPTSCTKGAKLAWSCSKWCYDAGFVYCCPGHNGP